jgi:hypothetical protein
VSETTGGAAAGLAVTPLKHQRLEIIAAVAMAGDGGADKSCSPVPQVKERFGLTLREAAAACQEAHLIRARA